jgi:hypothetical protein
MKKPYKPPVFSYLDFLRVKDASAASASSADLPVNIAPAAIDPVPSASLARQHAPKE